MFRASQHFRQHMSRYAQAQAPGAAAAAEAAQQQAARMQGRKPDNAFTLFRNVGASIGVGFLVLPHMWVQLFHASVSAEENESIHHKQANKWQEHMRGARRQSLKDFKEQYYGANEKLEQMEQTPGVYWDRFNNNTIVEQKHNPNYVEKMKKKKSVGMYDTVGAVDTSRTRDGNVYRRTRSEGYGKNLSPVAAAA